MFSERAQEIMAMVMVAAAAVGFVIRWRVVRRRGGKARGACGGGCGCGQGKNLPGQARARK